MPASQGAHNNGSDPLLNVPSSQGVQAVTPAVSEADRAPQGQQKFSISYVPLPQTMHAPPISLVQPGSQSLQTVAPRTEEAQNAVQGSFGGIRSYCAIYAGVVGGDTNHRTKLTWCTESAWRSARSRVRASRTLIAEPRARRGVEACLAWRAANVRRVTFGGSTAYTLHVLSGGLRGNSSRRTGSTEHVASTSSIRPCWAGSAFSSAIIGKLALAAISACRCLRGYLPVMQVKQDMLPVPE